MAHFPDLTPCWYFPESQGLGFEAIGWLEVGEEFATGEVGTEFFDRLCALLARPWQPPLATFGRHPCSLCRFTGGGVARYGGFEIHAEGDGFLFVPSGRRVFVSPSSIAHYVDAHAYRPPAEYQQAVLECPEMRSRAFLEALLRTDVREWMRRLRVVPEAERPGPPEVAGEESR